VAQETQWISLLDRCREQTAALRAELRRGIEFIESGTRLNVPQGELERMKALLSDLDAPMEKYGTDTG
jgi:hypothetical protein